MLFKKNLERESINQSIQRSRPLIMTSAIVPRSQCNENISVIWTIYFMGIEQKSPAKEIRESKNRVVSVGFPKSISHPGSIHRPSIRKAKIHPAISHCIHRIYCQQIEPPSCLESHVIFLKVCAVMSLFYCRFYVVT